MLFTLSLLIAGCNKQLPACNPTSKTERKTQVSADNTRKQLTFRTNLAHKTTDLLIGIDGSGSMLGHAKANDSAPWRRLLDSLILSAVTQNLEPRVFRVGGGTAQALPPNSFGAIASNPCFYNDEGCNSFKPIASSLQTLWSIQTSDDAKVPPLRLLISDLEVNRSDISELIQAIKKDIGSGATAGILALKLPFEGKVYNPEGVVIHQGSLQRPVYFLVTGPPLQVPILLSEIRKNMAQKGVVTQELAVIDANPTRMPLQAREAILSPRRAGSVGLPLRLGSGTYGPSGNNGYQFIKLNPEAKGFSLATSKPFRGGAERPDLGLVSLDPIAIRPDSGTDPVSIKITKMVVSGQHLRLDFEVPPTAPPGLIRATIPVLPEEWWIAWDRFDRNDPKAAEKTEGLLALMTTIGSETRKLQALPAAAYLCVAYQTNS